jgi:hypothetical protein
MNYRRTVVNDWSSYACYKTTSPAAAAVQVEAAAKEVAKELVVGLEDGVAAVGSSDQAAAAAAGGAAAPHAGAAGGGLFALREAAGQLAARAERSLEVRW